MTVRNGNSISMDITEDDATIRMTLVSALFIQFGSCFRHFDFNKITRYTYVVCKSGQTNSPVVRPSVLFLKLVQINSIFANNV